MVGLGDVKVCERPDNVSASVGASMFLRMPPCAFLYACTHIMALYASRFWNYFTCLVISNSVGIL